MIKIKQKNQAIVVVGILLLLFAVVYQNFTEQQNVLELVRQGEPETARLESIAGDYTSYKLWDAQDEFLGYAVIADASGYGGKLTMLSIVDEAGTIKRVSLLEDYETPLYLNKVLGTGLLDEIAGRNIQAGFADIDAISGATITTEAIFAAIQKGTTQIGNEQLGMDIPLTNEINLVWQDIVALILVILSILGSSMRNLRKLRPWLLALSVLFIGFIMNYSLTYSNFVSILSGNLPVFIERPVWYIMVPGILLVTLVMGRNFYCSWLCPFGAVQEGIYKSLNLYNFSPSLETRRKVHKTRWPMLWLVAIIALMYNNSGIAGYEPFSVFFDGSGTAAQWVIMLIVLLLSMAQMRFWCHNFCPVGAVLDFTALIKRKLTKSGALKKSKNEEQGVYLQHRECSSCTTKIALSKQDKFYIFLVSVVNILIILSLLESMGWIP